MLAPFLLRALAIGLWSATGVGLATSLLVLGAWAWFANLGRAPGAWPEADAIVVLSAGLRPDGSLDGFTAARVETGLALWRAGRAPNIVVSGGPHDASGRNVAAEMAARLIAEGAPAARIVVEGRAVSTFENARFTLMIARARGWRRLLVVTDDYHLARAGALFWYWRRNNDARVVGLAPAPGLAAVGTGRATLAVFREILAVPFNLLKAAGQSTLWAFGLGEGRTIR
ncbi:MAG: YdcF family protein [Pseudomonadota bacterium]